MEPEKEGTVEDLIAAKSEIKNKLRDLEQQIYDFEETYLREATNYSNLVTGYKAPQQSNSTKFGEKVQYRKADRIFSYSSVTSPNEDDHGTDENVKESASVTAGTASSQHREPGFLRPQNTKLRKCRKRKKH